jgi:hypothetical protein
MLFLFDFSLFLEPTLLFFLLNLKLSNLLLLSSAYLQLHLLSSHSFQKLKPFIVRYYHTPLLLLFLTASAENHQLHFKILPVRSVLYY